MDDLTQAAQSGNIEMLYQLIAADPHLLERIDEIPFHHTPLHVAASKGQTHFAIEIMYLKPSFARKLNPMGFSPLDLALRNDQTETVRRLVEIDSELIRVKGKGLWTPLHYVAQIDNVDLLAEFLIACPLSMNDLTVRKETAAHVAAANGHVQALKVLIGWIDRTNNNEILHCRDENGSTLLHIVALNHQHYADNLLDVLKLLQEKIENSEMNSYGYKALDIIYQSPYSDEQKKAAKEILRGQGTYLSTHSFAGFFSSPLKILEYMVRFDMNLTLGVSIEMVNVLLVIAALVVTATYQAVLQPPSVDNLNNILMQSNTNTTSPNTSQDASNVHRKMYYEAFLAFNTLTFGFSVEIIIVLLKMSLASIPVHLSLIFLWLNYLYLVLVRNVTFVIQFLSIVTLLFNYFTLLGRFALSTLGRTVPYKFHCLNRITSRLQMQHQTIRSTYSCQRRVDKE